MPNREARAAEPNGPRDSQRVEADFQADSKVEASGLSAAPAGDVLDAPATPNARATFRSARVVRWDAHATEVLPYPTFSLESFSPMLGRTRFNLMLGRRVAVWDVRGESTDGQAFVDRVSGSVARAAVSGVHNARQLADRLWLGAWECAHDDRAALAAARMSDAEAWEAFERAARSGLLREACLLILASHTLHFFYTGGSISSSIS